MVDRVVWVRTSVECFNECLFHSNTELYSSFRLYGLMVWCPEYLKLLRATEYKNHTLQIDGEKYTGQKFSGSLENRRYKDSIFLECKYVVI